MMLPIDLGAKDLQQLKDADNFRADNKLAKALTAIEPAYKLMPDDYDVLLHLVRAYNDIGESLQDQAKQNEAGPYFKKADKYVGLLNSKFPGRAEVQYYRAVISGNLDEYISTGKRVKMGHSVETFAKKALQIDPNFEPPYVVLGAFYREVAILNSFEKSMFGKVSGATLGNSEKFLRKAIELNPKDPFAFFELAKTLSERHKLKDARDNFKTVISLPPNDPRHAHLKVLANEALRKQKK
jgi:tetratricopeptide (TPR) repeat protein